MLPLRRFVRSRYALLVDPTTAAPALRPRLPRRRFFVAFTALGGGALTGALAVFGLLLLFVRLSWPHTEPAGTPAFGINFSCNYAEYLLLEDPTAGTGLPARDDRPGRVAWCAHTLGELLGGLGARHVRISAEWSQVEPRPGEYDWALIDALLAEADRHGTKVLLTVGIKAQRHPEYYIPGWVMERASLEYGDDVSTDAYVRERALGMIAAAVAHFGASQAVDSWGADNEPYVPSLRAENWSLGREFVRAEVETIRASDPGGRPVSINHGQHFVFDRRWQDALADADVLSQSLYPWRNYEILGRTFVIPILEIGPLAPNYNYQARLARERHQDFWITEMQAEPWVDGDIHLVSPSAPSANLTRGNFRRNLDYGRRIGASRIYLWGAEWWLYQRQRYGDSTWWDLARGAMQPASETALDLSR